MLFDPKLSAYLNENNIKKIIESDAIIGNMKNIFRHNIWLDTSVRKVEKPFTSLIKKIINCWRNSIQLKNDWTCTKESHNS